MFGLPTVSLLDPQAPHVRTEALNGVSILVVRTHGSGGPLGQFFGTREDILAQWIAEEAPDAEDPGVVGVFGPVKQVLLSLRMPGLAEVPLLEDATALYTAVQAKGLLPAPWEPTEPLGALHTTQGLSQTLTEMRAAHNELSLRPADIAFRDLLMGENDVEVARKVWPHIVRGSRRGLPMYCAHAHRLAPHCFDPLHAWADIQHRAQQMAQDLEAGGHPHPWTAHLTLGHTGCGSRLPELTLSDGARYAAMSCTLEAWHACVASLHMPLRMRSLSWSLDGRAPVPLDATQVQDWAKRLPTDLLPDGNISCSPTHGAMTGKARVSMTIPSVRNGRFRLAPTRLQTQAQHLLSPWMHSNPSVVDFTFLLAAEDVRNATSHRNMPPIT